MTEANSCRQPDSSMIAYNPVLFFALLQYKFLIPSSTMDAIMTNTEKLLENEFDLLLSSLTDILRKNGIDQDMVNKIINEPSLRNCSKDVLPSFRTEHSRKQYIQTNFNYVAPISHTLPGLDDNGKPATYQYVPLLETLKALFTDPLVKKQFLSISQRSDMYKDFSDGLALQNNPVFQSSCQTIQLILYADSFEVVNPLGCARRKHSIMTVYFTLANLDVYMRSKVHHFQLLLLCKDKFFSKDTLDLVLKPLIEDLKILESSGVDLGFPQRVLGSVVCVLGDNLSSHLLGGEEENDDLPSSSTAVVNPCNPSPHVEYSKKWLQCEYAKTDKDLHRAQTMMDDLFASQRQIIEAKTPLGKILEEWPFLQCEDILFSHFVTLVNRKRPEDDIRSTARVFCTRSYEVYR